MLLAKFASLVDSSGKISVSGVGQSGLMRQSSNAAGAESAAVATAEASSRGDGGSERQLSASGGRSVSQDRAGRSSPGPYAAALSRSASDKGLRSGQGHSQTAEGLPTSPTSQQQLNSPQGNGTG